MTEHFGLVDLGSKTLILAGALDFAFRVFVLALCHRLQAISALCCVV